MERAKRQRNGHKSDDETQKLKALVEKITNTATEGAEQLDLEFDAVYANGDELGLVVVINFNLKNHELEDEEKDNLFLERLGTLIEDQLESLGSEDPDEPEQ